MVLTDRQRKDLHRGIYQYLLSLPGEAFTQAARAFALADPEVCHQDNDTSSNSTNLGSTSLLEKKWTAAIRLQKRVIELEKSLSEKTSYSSTNLINRAKISKKFPKLPSLHNLQGHSATITCLALHPIYPIIASGSEDAYIKIWDLESGEFIKTLKGHTGTVNSLDLNRSHLASASSDLSIKLWDIKTLKCIRTFRGHDHVISSVLFLPSVQESSTLVSCSRDESVKFWCLETGFCVHTISGDHTDWIRCLAIRFTDFMLASAGNDAVIHLYSITQQGNARNSKQLGSLRGHTHAIESLAFLSPNKNEDKKRKIVEEYLVSGSRDKSIKVWNVSSRECLHSFSFHENWVRCVLLHETGDFIISCSDDRTIRVIDIKANRCIRVIEEAHEHFITCLASHDSLFTYVSGSVDQTLKCWSLD